MVKTLILIDQIEELSHLKEPNHSQTYRYWKEWLHINGLLSNC